MLLIFSKFGRSITLALTLMTLLVFAGCGEEKKPTGAVSGTVKSGGKLIGNCKVAIFNTTTMDSTGATVDESGTFTLNDVPYGNYQVKVYPMPTDSVEEIPDPRIPKKFRDYKASGITVSVENEEPKTLEIDLK